MEKLDTVLSHIRRVMHCVMNHKAWMQTRVFARPFALLLDSISSLERFGIISRNSACSDKIRTPLWLINQTSLEWEGKNCFDSVIFSGISKAIPPITA